jgi:hypothetical protein
MSNGSRFVTGKNTGNLEDNEEKEKDKKKKYLLYVCC